MRKIILTTLLVLMPVLTFGQSALDKFDGQDDVTSIVINKKMFELMSMMAVDSLDRSAHDYQELIKKIENLKVYSTTSKRATTEMKSAYKKYLKSAGLQELMRVSENGSSSVKIAVKPILGGNKIKELGMFLEGTSELNPTVLMSLTGDFDLNEVTTLTDKMKIPGSEELKNATKQKL